MANSATLAAKERGSKAYKNGNFVAAVVAYSEALAAASESDPERHLYYSNRCAAHLQLGKVDDALADAEGCVRLKPDWAKGLSRLGGCLVRKSRFQEAVVALEKAVDLDPANGTSMELLEEARRHARRNPPQNPSQNPQHGSSSTSQPSQSWSMPSLPFDAAMLQEKAAMAWFYLQENKQLMYGLIAVFLYLVFFRSSGYSGGYSDFGYGGYGGFLGTGYDLWTIIGIALVGWVAYKKGWHRNIQNMDPMTMLFLFNTLSNLLGRRGGGGYGHGYGGGYGGYGRRGYGRRGIF